MGRILVKFVFFIGLVVFALACAFVMALGFTLVLFLAAEPQDSDKVLIGVFAVAAFGLIVSNFNRNQRAADKFYEHRHPQLPDAY